MRASGRLERALLFFGLFLISIYLGSRVYSAVYAQAGLQRFWADPGNVHRHSEARVLGRQVGPDFRLWSGKRVKAYKESLLANVSPPLAVLDIPTLHIQVPVLEGTDDFTLDRAVGHIAGTALPGWAGNIGIAGHRDGFFRGLKDLKLGETINLYDQDTTSTYVVDEIEIVSPENVSVLAPRRKSALTLVTCYPFYFVGAAPMRYIVHATAADSNRLRSSAPSDLPAKGPAGAARN
jgi:sortase A